LVFVVRRSSFVDRRSSIVDRRSSIVDRTCQLHDTIHERRFTNDDIRRAPLVLRFDL